MNWRQRFSQRKKAYQRAIETPGVPVPGTNRRGWHKPQGKKLRPYIRPRKGGGAKGKHELPWGPRAEGPFEA